MTETVGSTGSTPAEQRAVSAVTAENAAAVAATLLLEQQAVEAAAGPLRTAVRNVLRLLSTRYVLMFGSLEAPADPVRARMLTEMFAQEIEPLRELDPVPEMRAAADRARRAGAEYANQYLRDEVPEAEVPLDPAVERVLEDVPRSMAEAVDAAQQYAEQTPIESFKDVVQQVGKAAQAATGVERQTAWAVNRANSSSMSYVAVQRGARLLWVAEPDACQTCLALSGHLADPALGEGFDEEATFGRAGSAPAVWPPGHPLMHPPRHPMCRCIAELWFGPAAEPGGPTETSLYNRPGVGANVDLPAALRREAKRSILYGWSLPSESGTVRLDAAARLLAHGAGLPKSVEARSRAMVKAGRFDSRVHPSKRRTAHRP